MFLSPCPGTLPRRGFLRAGFAGLAGAAGLSLSSVLRAEAQAAAAASQEASNKSIIMLWLWGGPSHMETFDLKPDAPSEYRGQFRPISTNVPGLDISEHLPQLARLGDKFSLIRSLGHDSSGHVNSTHTMLTGFPGEPVETPPFRPQHPDVWSVASKVLGACGPGVPTHVTMPRLRYHGSAYLGGGLDPFTVTGDPNDAKFKVPNLALSDITIERFNERRQLQSQFDRMRRAADTQGQMASIDTFDEKAVALLTGNAARDAFDLSREEPATRDRYGRHAVGQRCLLARRLVEAGVRLVSIDFPTVPGQKARSWDDHASVWNIFEEMKIRLPVLDQVVSALVEDLYTRGLADDVLLVVMGEMSHTPRLSNFKGQPGREHWGKTMSVFLSGGGLQMGQAVGSTNRKGDEALTRPLSPNDLLATWYHYLGVPTDLHFNDAAGRPVPIVPNGTAIAELL